MELTSKWFGIDITISELIALIPEIEWKRIEEKILKKAKEEYNEPFTSIDLNDSEGKLDFGIGT